MGLILARGAVAPSSVRHRHYGRRGDAGLPKGGDLQVGARIAMRQLDALVFFVDPGSPHAHENDVQALIRISLVADIPVALNRASADHLAEAMFVLRAHG